MGTPKFGSHFLINSFFVAYQWGYIHSRYPSNSTVITIGGANSQYIASGDGFQMSNTVQMNNKDSWTLQLTSLKYYNGSANVDVVTTTSSSPMNVTFNVSSPIISVPVSVFGTLSTYFTKSASSLMCVSSSGKCYFNGLCSEITNSLGSFTFNFGGSRSYTMPNDYLIDYPNDNKCYVEI
jgi:hypothetical protein